MSQILDTDAMGVNRISMHQSMLIRFSAQPATGNADAAPSFAIEMAIR